MPRLCILLGALLFAHVARAADHRDAPATRAAPEGDINDVYTWMSSDGTKVYLAMTVSPLATAASKFSDQILYVFHLKSKMGFDAADAMRNSIICGFNAAQAITCWVGPASATGLSSTSDFATGDASKPAGLESMGKTFKVFAGLRDDPFFFNLDGFNETVKKVVMATPTLVPLTDASGCPHLPKATADALAGQLAKDPMGNAAKDFFAKANTLAIVIAIDKAAVTSGGPILGVWASTNRR